MRLETRLVVKDARQQAPEKKHSSVISFLFCLDRGNGEEILNQQCQVFVFKCFFQVKFLVWISNFVVEIPCVFLSIRPNLSYPIQDVSTSIHSILLYWNCSFFQDNFSFFPQEPIIRVQILSLKMSHCWHHAT